MKLAAQADISQSASDSRPAAAFLPKQLLLQMQLPSRPGLRTSDPKRPKKASANCMTLAQALEWLESETKRSRFFNLSIEMLSIAGFDGLFKQLNPAWQSVLGFSEEELKAKPFVDWVHPDDREATRQQIEICRAAGVPVQFENRYLCKDGTYRWLGWTAGSFAAEQLLYLFARDNTEQKVAEIEILELNATLALRAAQLEHANQELERELHERKRAEQAMRDTNAELEAFCYSVSHDLRAPLRAIQGFSEALLEDCADDLGDSGKTYAERLVKAAARMERLIHDLLQFSRVSYHAVQFEPVDVEMALDEAKRQLEDPIRRAGAEIETSGEWSAVLAHQATLVQVLCNLLSNAIRFVPSKTQPRVRVRMEKCDAGGRIWVEDNGIGIPEEFHSRIFRVFERLHPIETYPGTGIGLAIVRKGIERMGGRCGVESQPGQGSQFWFELPVVPSPENHSNER